jgi:hypothetical protein
MDTNMEDVGRPPADVSPVPLEPTTIPTLDGWIESLMTCKQLAESDVQRLCEKVSHLGTQGGRAREGSLACLAGIQFTRVTQLFPP